MPGNHDSRRCAGTRVRGFAIWLPLFLVAGTALLVGCSDSSGGALPDPPDPPDPPAPNAAPTADFIVSCYGLTCFPTTRSTDADGSVVAHSWDFGDGQSSAAPNPTHTYASPGAFTVTLTITDDDGAPATAAKLTNVAPAIASGRAGVYARETPHSASGRHSRYIIWDDGTFEMHDETGTGRAVHTGEWVDVISINGLPVEPGAYIEFFFDDIPLCFGCDPAVAYGSFLFGPHMAIAYNQAPFLAGLEEGVYTSAPDDGTPVSPAQPGQIAFVRDGRIYSVNTDGTGLVAISDGPDDRYPAWSPDGSRIAFARSIGDIFGVFIVDADGSDVVQRTVSAGTLFGVSPTWSPDGEWIAFECSGAGQNGICKVKAANDGTTSVAVYQSIGSVTQPAWSPDGTRIAFISDEALYDIFFDVWVMASDGSQPAALRTHGAAGANADEQWQPAWSPDGQRIAHVECPYAFFFCSSSAITVMNSDGSGVVRLAAASGFAGPTWSPDGQAIAFASCGPSVRCESMSIDWVSADGTQRGTIVANGHSPAWKP